MVYDLFYVSRSVITPTDWQNFKNRFPTAIKVENVSNINDLKKKSFTKLFWVVWDDLEIAADFNFDYRVPKWDLKYIHTFRNTNAYDGVVLIPKDAAVSDREFFNRHFLEKKEIDINASCFKFYKMNTHIETYDEYLEAIKKSPTEMFWIVPNDVIVLDTFKFDIRFSYDNEYDRNMNHVFLNGEHYDGIMLMSKNKVISRKEFENRFPIERKEWDIVASRPKPYDKFCIDYYDEYLRAVKESTTDMFWMIPSDVVVNDSFKFDLYFTHYNQYDRNINHVFLNGEEYNGLILMSKNKVISRKEFENRFPIERKEWNIVASQPKPYDRFIIDTYDDYEKAKASSSTNMFWIIPKEVEILDYDFSLRFKRDDYYDKSITHVFQHLFRGQKTFNGVCLTSNTISLSEKEIFYRFPVNKKEHNILVSRLRPYDIIFISYNESTADENYQRLLERFPKAKRIHGVKGIHQAHIEAAKLSDTDMFWVVDADAVIKETFNFDYEVSRYELDIVHVWYSQNPINDLVYGYGGVKLFPKKLTINMDTTKTDMTTSISTKFKSMPVVSNISAFNTDEFNTWKSAFRECVKLASRIIDRQEDSETDDRLTTWKTSGRDKPFGDYAIQGAIDGEQYGLKYKNDKDALSKINDFNWLKQHYEQRTKNIHS